MKFSLKMPKSRVGFLISIIEFLIILIGYLYISHNYPYVFHKNPVAMVIDVRGDIISNYRLASWIDPLDVDIGAVTSSDYVRQTLEFYSKDENIRAFILEIDSPGGQDVAYEEIAREVLRTEKPVVAVVRGSALSTGYAVAASTDRMFVSAHSEIGGLGVVSGYSERMKNGTWQTCNLASTPYKGMVYDDCPGFDPEMLEKYKNYLEISHKMFMQDMAYLRNVSVRYMEPLADGRSIHGYDAVQLGLADQIGDTTTAVEWLENELGTDLDVIYARYLRKPSEISET